MNTAAAQLSPNECRIAHHYWHTLLFPATHHDLHSARRGLKNEAPQIVEAVMDALLVVWARDVDPTPQENPFSD